LIVEEANLRELRKARERSQVQVAKQSGIQQAAVSKPERRADMYASTLRDYIRAVGGDLEIIARFPERSPVLIAQFASPGHEDKIIPSEHRARRPTARKGRAAGAGKATR
jgi:transcriptional regulator with XRE-family HTH domain